MVEVPRDPRWGRPLIEPVGGGKLVPYTRISTLAKALSDTTQLTQWKQRQTVIGLVRRPDLLTLASTQTEDKKALNVLVDQAFEAAGSSAAANIGTALHSITEAIDSGQDPDVPAEFVNDALAYRQAVNGAKLTAHSMEQFVVIDELKVGGSFDRIWETAVGLMIGDLKTGKDTPKYGSQETAIQMALYAHGKLYDPATGERTPLPEELRTDLALLLHLPIRTGRCSIYQLPLDQAWEMAQIAVRVREWRKGSIAQPFQQ